MSAETPRWRPSASTRVAAVIGAPVSHSRSPALHNAGFRAAGIDAVYLAMHIEPRDLTDAINGFRALGFLGVSVTVPHKRAVIELCDALAPPADTIGAVNCLTFERGETGKVRVVGHNTDAGGFVDSLSRQESRSPNRSPTGLRTVLLGAGGAARAVHAGLQAAGAAITAVVTRTPENASWVRARPWTTDELERACTSCDLLVDCTSTGLSPEAEASIPCPIPVAALPDDALVASLVYHREPTLLTTARRRGLATLDGAGMLVYQGTRAFELWTGQPAPEDAMWQAFRAALGTCE